MRWTTPDFQEISLSGEVTAYVNTDDAVNSVDLRRVRVEPVRAAAEKAERASAQPR
jgi:coenzyme PQQ precursor peptide PqqA